MRHRSRTFETRSSPRRRGSAVVVVVVAGHGVVLPAQAGVSRCPRRSGSRGRGPPRVGGGQPSSNISRARTCASSPRRRGSAESAAVWAGAVQVLPAQAGVSRWSVLRVASSPGPPRAGGGQPLQGRTGPVLWRSSPRRRGSAGDEVLGHLGAEVLPAQAGVSRRGGCRSARRAGPPRAGGGQPLMPSLRAVEEASSPRRRGSAAPRVPGADPSPVLPAQAGVSRGIYGPHRIPPSPPRAGGGQPR